MRWDDLRIFLAIERTGTLRGAARVLGVNHATVSRRLEALEAALGASLFIRRREGLVLSQAGEDLRAAGTRVEEEMLAIERRLAGKDMAPSGVVRLSLPPALLRSFLVDELAAFAAAHPAIELDIDASHSFSDLARREADVSIRLAKDVTEDLVGRRVATYRKAVYIARGKSEASGVTDWSAPTGRSWIGWGKDKPSVGWLGETPFPELPVRHAVFSNLLQIEFAKRGMGLALLPCFLGDTEPGLVRVPGTSTLPGMSIWILFHGDFQKTARIRAFVDFIVPAIQKHRPLLYGDCPSS